MAADVFERRSIKELLTHAVAVEMTAETKESVKGGEEEKMKEETINTNSSLFPGRRYSFVGKDNMSSANEVMGKASDITEEIKSGLS